ncbi:MAG: hypothetical protein AB1724_17875 [Thermodesulfobacteriota bacterium]
MRSCIDQKRYFRYRFEPSAQAAEHRELVFIPYWRFKGTLFYATREKGVANQFLDISRIALPAGINFLPASLGVRSQALPLKLVSADHQGRFLTPCRLQETMDEFDRVNQVVRLKVATIFREYIGETASLIYSPVYVENRQLYDAVLDQPLSLAMPDDRDVRDMDTCRPEGETIFIPGLCPDCGWDLEGAAQSLTLTCLNCRSLWRPRRGALVRVRFGLVASDNPDAVYLPFWRMEADVAGVPLASYADMVRLANLPRVVQTAWEEMPLAFWSTAFKVRGDIFHRLNQQLTCAQPRTDLAETITNRRLHPITLPAAEGLESIKITLISILRPPEDWLPRYPDISVFPTRVTLVFLPFEDRRLDLYYRDINLSIDKNVLAHAGNL